MDKHNLLCSYVVRNGKTDMKQSFADATVIINGLKNGMGVDDLFNISNKNGKPLALVGYNAVDWFKTLLNAECGMLNGKRVVLNRDVLQNLHECLHNVPHHSRVTEVLPDPQLIHDAPVLDPNMEKNK